MKISQSGARQGTGTGGGASPELAPGRTTLVGQLPAASRGPAGGALPRVDLGTPPGGAAGRQPLEESTRARMESSFGVGFGDVNIHPDSPRASGSTQAFTEGPDIHFAPGRYDPGSAGGNWLIAHELAHVVQQSGGGTSQQRFDPAEPGLAHEVEADRAADAAMAGGKAEVQLSTRDGARQAYEAWEHRALADSRGGSARTITVNCGITLTYGQVCALSGDFYRSPEALMNAPRQELEAILRTMHRERGQAGVTEDNAFGTGAPTQDQINQNNADYEMATTGPESRAHHHVHDTNPFLDDADHEGSPDTEHAHGRVTQGNHVEDNGEGGAPPSATEAFLGLADNNASHFSPENIRLNFIPKHQLAIDLAKEAWRARNPGATPADPISATSSSPGTPDQRAPGQMATAPGPAPTARGHAPTAPVPLGAAAPTAVTVSTASSDPGQRQEAMAYLSDGFAAHFLTDAFASGHLVSGSVGRRIGADYYQRHMAAIHAALRTCLLADNPVLLGQPHIAESVVMGMSGMVASKAGSLTLKLVHDYFNRHGVDVKNPLGTQWRTVGDANLASSPMTQEQCSLAAQASREGVEKAVREGELTDVERDTPLQYVPSEAKFASGAYQPIEAFCSDATIFDAILSATMLSHDPGKNELWKMLKGNAAPMIAVYLRRAGRAIGHFAEETGQAVNRGARAVGREVTRSAQAVGEGIVSGARTVRDGAVAGAEVVGRGARAIGREVAHGAQVAGEGIMSGAQAVGDGITAGVEASERGARDAAGWVRSLFD